MTREPLCSAKFIFYADCQNSFRSSNQGLRWSDWNHVLPRCKLFDSFYSRPGFILCSFAFLIFFFIFNLPYNMVKNYRSLFNTFACCLLFLRARKAWTCLTPLSPTCRAEIIGSVFCSLVAQGKRDKCKIQFVVRKKMKAWPKALSSEDECRN